jgi:hypothetical protein
MLESRLKCELGDFSIFGGPERAGHGLDTYIYGFSLAGEGLPLAWARPLILRVFAPHQEQKARRETDVQDFLSRGGFPAPRPLMVGGPDNGLGRPFMIMERVPGSPMLDRFKNPLAIPGLLRRMALLQARLHGLPLDDCPLPYERPCSTVKLAELREQVRRYRLSDMRAPLTWLQDNRRMVRTRQPASLRRLPSAQRDALGRSPRARPGLVGRSHRRPALRPRAHPGLFWLAPPLSRVAPSASS